MKRGVMNYSITWNQDGEKHEEIHFSKLATIKNYIDLIYADVEMRLDEKSAGISSLKVFEIYTNPTTLAKDITGKINAFIY